MLRLKKPNQSPLDPKIIEEIVKKVSETMKQSIPFDIWLQRTGACVGVIGGIAAVLAAFHAAVTKLPEISIKLSNLEKDNKDFKNVLSDTNKEYNKRFDTVIAEYNKRFDTVIAEYNRRFDTVIALSLGAVVVPVIVSFGVIAVGADKNKEKAKDQGQSTMLHW